MCRGRDMRGIKSQEFHAFIAEKKSELPQIDTIGALGPDGMRLSQSRSWPVEEVDLSTREYFAALSANPNIKSFIGESIASFATGTWVVVIARPVVAKDGRFLGVVFASTDMAYFENMFRATSLGDGYAVTLLRRDGTLLVRYPRAGVIGTVVPASVLERIADTNSGLSRSVSPVDHQARIAAAHRLADYPVAVVVTQTDAAAFAAWRRAALTMGLVTLAMNTSSSLRCT